MNVFQLLSEIDAEIARLQQARALLAGHNAVAGQGPATKRRRSLSAEARAKIAEAQRRRWAKQKKSTK